MKREYELVPHPQMASLHVFLVRVDYRAPHAHMEIEIGIVLEGALLLSTNRGNIVVQAGEMYYLNSMDFHELQSKGNTALVLAIQISEGMIAPYYPVIRNLVVQDVAVRPYFVAAQAQYESCLALSAQLTLHYLSCMPHYEFLCTALLNQLLFELCQRLPHTTLSEPEIAANASRNSRINRVLDEIDQNFQRKLLLSELAEKEGLTLTYLSHFFKDTLNMTFQNYLAERRFSNAVLLLETTDLSMLDISLASGFSDVRYLNQLCQKHYGCTPMAYRKARRQRAATPLPSGASAQTFIGGAESKAVLLRLIETWSRSHESGLPFGLFPGSKPASAQFVPQRAVRAKRKRFASRAESSIAKGRDVP